MKAFVNAGNGARWVQNQVRVNKATEYDTRITRQLYTKARYESPRNNECGKAFTDAMKAFVNAGNGARWVQNQVRVNKATEYDTRITRQLYTKARYDSPRNNECGKAFTDAVKAFVNAGNGA
ncbi:hypothetical protein B0H13DRAFT_1877501 [Mycena leptocephala]|nr:hypothetical protein B0H13DRAFT_1877501 [Mycena leptocephala]